MISELPEILELQKFMQHEFNYKLDKQTAVDKSVKQFLSELPMGMFYVNFFVTVF